MGSYPENVEKTKTCLCKKFSAGGEFSQTKIANVCGSNPRTPPNHLPLLQDKIVCGEMKLVKVEGKNRWTLVVPDDEFESPLQAMKKELMEKFHALSSSNTKQPTSSTREKQLYNSESQSLEQMKEELRERFEELKTQRN